MPESSYTVRVELHGAKHDAEVYEELHEEMESRGFSRTITTDSGATYQLPPAEYDWRGDKDKKQVFALARAAVEAIGWRVGKPAAGQRCGAILVTTSAGRQFDGLADA